MEKYDPYSAAGCGCLKLIVIAIIFLTIGIRECVNKRNGKDSSPVVENKNDDITDALVPYGGINEKSTEDVLSEEDKKYLNNSLPTGTTPYSPIYGKNYRCPYNRCSGIKVTAPHEADIVVIIKRNNDKGKVVAHGYIQSGDSFQFDLSDGTYQTFFYYGQGWNPNKVMPGGIKGGFVKDEFFSKDDPQDIYSGILTYVLQLKRNGNFQTKGSSANEMF